ncbi:MAG TPA: hypothetical protein VFQ54_03350, partial [Thermomicrobiales bacterium]|nr:hypothetical protein [Thermomicrobiales bacterium]
ELNIKVTMTPLVWPDMVARAADPKTSPGMMAVYASADYIDPDNFLWSQYQSGTIGSWANASQYANPDFDKLLVEARGTVDPAKRKDIYDQAQTMLVDQAVEIWVYCEVSNDSWVAQLGPDGLSKVNGDIRVVQYTS